MNLQAKTLFFFAVPILILFSACKSKKNLGQDFVPDNEKIGMYSDSIPLEFASMRVDSVYSGGLTFYLMGQQNYNDVISSEVSTYARFHYEAPNIDAAAVCDSMFITIGKVGAIYGDSIQDFTLKVFRTLETVDTTQKKVYRFPGQAIATEATPLAQATFIPSMYKGDSTSIRMRVAPELATQIFEAAKTAKSDTAFSRIMKSLAYKGSTAQGNTLLMINRSSISVVLYYTFNKTSYILNLSPYKSNTVSAYGYIGYNNVYKGHLASLKNKDTLKTTDAEGKAYLQSYSSIAIKTKLPTLEATVGTKADQILINKAELFIKSPASFNTYTNSKYDPGLLYVRYSNPNRGDVKVGGSYYLLSSIFTTPYEIASYYDVSRQSYRINLTEYIQNLIDEKVNVRDLIIETTNPGLITVGDGTQNSKNFILKIHYSKLK